MLRGWLSSVQRARRRKRRCSRDRRSELPGGYSATARRQDRRLGGPAVAAAQSSHMVAIARNRVDHGDLFDWKIGHDLYLVVVNDQHLLDTDAIAEALAVLGFQRERHAWQDLDGV